MKFTITLVVAVAENGVIGRRGTLPWRVPSDMKIFRRLTLGKPVIMGRKTYASIGKPLGQRDNIVVTRDAAFCSEGVERAGSIEDALELARARAKSRGVEEIMVIGGAEIFAAVMPMADRIWLTRIHARPEGDTFFPEPDPRCWREVSRATVVPDPRDEAPATLLEYERAAR